MNAVAEDEPAPVLIEVIVSPVEVKIAIRVHIGKVGVAVRINPRRLYLMPSMTPPVEYSPG